MNTRVLEIGSAYGFMLNLFHRSGWQVTGVEPARDCAAYCREEFDIPVLEESFSESTLEGRTFDLIVLSHVLEHILHPVAFLSILTSRLERNGFLAIEVPNITNPQSSLELCHMNGAHLSYFSPNSLRQALARAGLEVVVLDEVERGIRTISTVGASPISNRIDAFRELESRLRRHQRYLKMRKVVGLPIRIVRKLLRFGR
jgi:SAM-dependent methyltransferase